MKANVVECDGNAVPRTMRHYLPKNVLHCIWCAPVSHQIKNDIASTWNYSQSRSISLFSSHSRSPPAISLISMREWSGQFQYNLLRHCFSIARKSFDLMLNAVDRRCTNENSKWYKLINWPFIRMWHINSIHLKIMILLSIIKWCDRYSITSAFVCVLCDYKLRHYGSHRYLRINSAINVYRMIDKMKNKIKL